MNKTFTRITLISLLVVFLFPFSHAQVTSYASLPYSTGFETGMLDANWYTTGSRIQIWNSTTLTWGGNTAMAHTDSLWLGLDNSPGGSYITNEAWMGLNLAGASDVRLRFWWAEWNDESEPQDGVYMSDNGGSTFTKVLDLPGASYTDLQWYPFNLSIDSLALVHGFSLTGTFVVKFQQYDNYYFAGGNDGHMYDDIEVTGLTGCDTPPMFTNVPDDSIYSVSSGCDTVVNYDPVTAINFGCNSNLKITEVKTAGTDHVEIQNLHTSTQNYTGWVVAAGVVPSSINTVNPVYWNLGTMTSGQVDYRSGSTGPNYWGAPLNFTSGNNCWVMIIDDQGNVADAVFWGWDSTSIANFNATINGFTITGGPHMWNGAGVAIGCSNSMLRTSDIDSNDSTNFTCTNPSPGVANSGYSPLLKGDPVVTQIAGLASGSTFPLGVTTNTFVATDTFGLADTMSFTVTVNDVANPAANCLSALTLQLPSDGDTLLSGIEVDNGSTDNCGIQSMVASPNYFNCSDIGTTATVTLTVTDSSGNSSTCTASVTINDNLGATALPINLGADTTVCPGQTVLLDAGFTGSTFLWSSGSPNQSYTATTSGTYWVQVTDTQGCVGSDTIVVDYPPTADLGPDASLCDGSTLTLNPGISGSTYNWSTSDTTSTLVVSSGGTYAVTVTDIYGCTTSDTVNISVTAAPSAAFTATQGAGSGLTWDFTDGSTGSPTSWMWDFGDGNTSTTQNPTHTYATDGSYTVTLIISSACGNDTLTMPIVVTSIWGNGGEGSVNVYPNPNQGRFTVEMSQVPTGPVDLVVNDLNGKVVYSQRLENNGGQVRQEVVLNDVAAGTYFVILQSAEGKAVKKITVE